MTMLMSFWTRCKPLIVIQCIVSMSGCASLKSPYPVSMAEKYEENPEFDSRDSRQFQKAVFSKYCNAGKQIARYKLSIRSILPKARQGMPLDEANKLLSKLADAEKFMVKSSLIGLSATCDPNPGSNECVNRGSNLFYRVEDSREDVTNYAKNLRYDAPNGFFDLSDPIPLFLFLDDKRPIIFLIEKRTQDSLGSQHGARYGRNMNQNAFLIELSALKKGYTMMIPANVQESIPRNQAEELKQFTDKYLNNNEPYGALNSGLIESVFSRRLGYAYNSDKLSAEAALSDQKDIWTRYLIAFTTIKESPSSDPQMLDYELNLDLGQFCQYARHVGDLISK